MCADLISVWFLCKLCQASFQKLENFIEHKKHKHLKEFQNCKCIVFEETTHQNRPQDCLDKEPQLSKDKCDHNQTNQNKESRVDCPIPASVSASVSNPTTEHVNKTDTSATFGTDPHKSLASHPLPSCSRSIPTSSSTNRLNENKSNTPNPSPSDVLPDVSDDPYSFQIKSECGGTDSDSNDVDDTFLHPNIVYENSDTDTDVAIKVDPDPDPGTAPTQNADDGLLLTPQNSPRAERAHSSCSNLQKISDNEPTSNPVDLNKRRLRRRKVKISTTTNGNKDSSEPSVVLRPFICEMCGRAFKTRKTMLSHHITHSDLRPHRCSRPDCPAAFKSKIGLYCHEKDFHSNVKPYRCPQSSCSKYFKTKRCANRHFERAHTVRERIQCPELNCDKLLASNQNLKSHLKLQHGYYGGNDREKRCVCDVCGKQFTGNALLQDHMLSHSEERPHSCPVEGCTSTFKRKRCITTHVQKRHTNNNSGDVPRGK